MSADSRHSNGSYPPKGDSGSDSADDECLPSVEGRVNEMLDEYGDRALVPMSVEHGRKLRREAFEEPEMVRREVDTGDGETGVVEDLVSRSALPWVAVVEEFLEWSESYRDAYLRLEKGRPGLESHEEFEVPLDTSWSKDYNNREYAQWQALERETCGGTRPSGGECVGGFAVPAVGVVTLGGSSLDGGEFRSPVDHDREIVDAWGGRSGVRRSMKYVLEERLGLSPTDYVWRKQAEPHTGKRSDGRNLAAGYSHQHVVLIFDAAEIDRDLPVDGEGRPSAASVTGEMRRVVEKHVELCEFAGEVAHDLDKRDWEASAGDVGTVTVAYEGDDGVKNPAAYAAKYVAVDTEKDLLERPIEYLMWGAAQWASSTQKYTQSRSAVWASTADACKQRFEDSDAHQSHDHGEKVVRSDRPGVEFECAACGSPWGVSQDHDTVTEAVLGNRDADDCGGEESSDGSLRGLWRDADEGARVGSDTAVRECDHGEPNTCPLCAESVDAVGNDVQIPDAAAATETVSEGRESFERPARWRPVAVRKGEEEHLIGAPGGSVFEEVVVEGVDAIPPGKLISVHKLEVPNPRERYGIDPTEYPPPELITRQLGEIHDGRPLTATAGYRACRRIRAPSRRATEIGAG